MAINTTVPKPLFNRLTVYFTERFPILIYLPFVSVLYLSLSFLTQLLSGSNLFIDQSSIIGITSIFFIMLLIRTFDDIKDEDLDHEIFPDRPVSRGAVLITDVKMLSVLSFIILVGINVIFAQKTILIFSIMMIYALLTFKWFFAKELHLSHPKIAMTTHQPLPLVTIFFLLHTALASGNSYDVFTVNHFFLLLLFALPITAWEVSRKIKAKENENKYETFSKIFGTTAATLIPIILYSLTGLISIFIGYKLGFHPVFYVVIVLILIFLNYFFIRFLRKPTPQHNILQKVAMVFTSLLFLTIIIFLLIEFPIKIEL